MARFTHQLTKQAACRSMFHSLAFGSAAVFFFFIIDESSNLWQVPRQPTFLYVHSPGYERRHTHIYHIRACVEKRSFPCTSTKGSLRTPTSSKIDNFLCARFWRGHTLFTATRCSDFPLQSEDFWVARQDVNSMVGSCFSSLHYHIIL